jgi:uncharacterized protein YndB with AHSA1/START domain
VDKNLIARASVIVNASSDEVWEALVDPDAIRQYMFGATVVSDWREGSPIIWKGEWQGKSYEDRGVIQQLRSGRRLQYTHFSPLSGLPDEPESYHTVTIDLSGEGAQTRISLTQDKNPSEQAREHSERNWTMVLAGLKKLLER